MDNRLVGYLVYNPVNRKIIQFATDPEFRRKKIASTLFSHAIPAGVAVAVINVDEASDATNEFLKKIGLSHFVEQLEMEMELT
jgi:ribosomal protein S18 acetylase RimI-like enzyme